jgi:uncharacterized C2H2 Zn-finger protein
MNNKSIQKLLYQNKHNDDGEDLYDCPYCNNQIIVNDKYCNDCGKKLKWLPIDIIDKKPLNINKYDRPYYSDDLVITRCAHYSCNSFNIKILYDKDTTIISKCNDCKRVFIKDSGGISQSTIHDVQSEYSIS